MADDLFNVTDPQYATNGSTTDVFNFENITTNRAGLGKEHHKDEGLGNLLWLPYIFLGGSLLALVLMSFCHYHIKHGNRYQRRRRFAALRKLNVAAMLHQMHEQVEIMGQHQQQQEDGSTRCTTPSISMATTGNSSGLGGQGSTKRKRKLFSGQWSSRSRLKVNNGYSEVFASNDNGSMVNVQLDKMQACDTWLVSRGTAATSDAICLPLINVTDDISGDLDPCRLTTDVTMESFLHLSASTRSMDATYA